MLRGLLALSLVFVASATADTSCVTGDRDDAVSLIAAGKPIPAAPSTPGDTRVVHAIRSDRCVVTGGTRVSVLGQGDGLATIRVVDGPSADCIGEVSLHRVSACAAPVEARPMTARAPEPESTGDADLTMVAAGRISLSNTTAAGPAIVRWKTPDGRVFFGDKPPRGSVPAGSIRGEVEIARAGQKALPSKAKAPSETHIARAPGPDVGGDSAAIAAE